MHRGSLFTGGRVPRPERALLQVRTDGRRRQTVSNPFKNNPLCVLRRSAVQRLLGVTDPPVLHPERQHEQDTPRRDHRDTESQLVGQGQPRTNPGACAVGACALAAARTGANLNHALQHELTGTNPRPLQHELGRRAGEHPQRERHAGDDGGAGAGAEAPHRPRLRGRLGVRRRQPDLRLSRVRRPVVLQQDCAGPGGSLSVPSDLAHSGDERGQRTRSHAHARAALAARRSPLAARRSVVTKLGNALSQKPLCPPPHPRHSWRMRSASW